MLFSKENRGPIFNGILFVTLLALSSLYLSELSWITKSGISALVIAIILGIIYGNTLRHHLSNEWMPGIQFSAKHLLRTAIVLYGFRISFQEIISVGIEGLILDILIVSSTLILGSWIGVKLFKLDRHLSLLITSGSAICGAAAVLATESVIKSEPYKATVAIGTVVLFGTIAMFLYPALQHANIFGFNDNQFGIFAGASIHEVAQVLIAGNNISEQAGNLAIIVKMTRVILLVPALICLSFYNKRISGPHKSHKFNLNVPWFALFFIIAIGFNSLHLLPNSFVALINQFDIFLLTMAMAAIGIETNLIKIKKVGFKPLYLAMVLFGWLISSVYIMVKVLVS